MYVYKLRTSDRLVDICWWADKEDEDSNNVGTLQLNYQRFFMEIVQLWQFHVWLPLGHVHLLLIRSGIINLAGSLKVKCWSPNDHLFSLTSSYLDVVPEEKKESSFLCLSTTTFLFSVTFSHRTRNPDKRRIWMKRTLNHKIAHFRTKMTLLNVTRGFQAQRHRNCKIAYH